MRPRSPHSTPQWPERAVYSIYAGLPATVRAKDVAQTLHAMILGHVVQVAIMDDANPKAVARGLAGFHAGKETPRQSRSPLR